MTTPTYIQCGLLTPDQIRKLAVCEVKLPLSRDPSTKDTPSDIRMGALNNGVDCGTCSHTNLQCPGHFGYIQLDEPVYNRLFLKYILKILQCVCPYCSKPRMKPEHAEIQSLLSRKGLKRFNLLVKVLETIVRCPYGCEQAMPYYFLNGDDIKKYPFVKGQKPVESKVHGIIVQPSDVLTIFTRMTRETCSFLGMNGELSESTSLTSDGFHLHEIRPEALLYVNFPVIPPCSRPHIIVNGEQKEDHLTDMYNAIIIVNNRLREEREGTGKAKRRRGGSVNVKYNRENDIIDLRLKVWSLIDNQKKLSKLSSGGKSHKSIIERLTKKTGRIQGNIMAVRVDFSGRSVITGGGTLIPAGYLGVPKYVCAKLTKKEIAREWNLEYLQALTDVGQVPSIYRGGKATDVTVLQQRGRFLIRLGDIVERRLQKGDYVAFNRQPTLRLESWRVFKCLPIDGYTFRFSLYETGAFNAD